MPQHRDPAWHRTCIRWVGVLLLYVVTRAWLTFVVALDEWVVCGVVYKLALKSTSELVEFIDESIGYSPKNEMM